MAIESIEFFQTNVMLKIANNKEIMNKVGGWKFVESKDRSDQTKEEGEEKQQGKISRADDDEMNNTKVSAM